MNSFVFCTNLERRLASKLTIRSLAGNTQLIAKGEASGPNATNFFLYRTCRCVQLVQIEIT